MIEPKTFNDWLRQVERRLVRLERRPAGFAGQRVQNAIGVSQQVVFTAGVGVVDFDSPPPTAVLAGFDAASLVSVGINGTVTGTRVTLYANVSDGVYVVSMVFFDPGGIAFSTGRVVS